MNCFGISGRSSFSGEVVALKKLKMEREKGGFPITSLREINTLLKAQHDNIVTVRVSFPPPKHPPQPHARTEIRRRIVYTSHGRTLFEV